MILSLGKIRKIGKIRSRNKLEVVRGVEGEILVDFGCRGRVSVSVCVR